MVRVGDVTLREHNVVIILGEQHRVLTLMFNLLLAGGSAVEIEEHTRISSTHLISSSISSTSTATYKISPLRIKALHSLHIFLGAPVLALKFLNFGPHLVKLAQLVPESFLLCFVLLLF